MTSATTAQLATEAKSRREQDAVLAAAIGSLSARVYALENPGVVVPPPVITPPPATPPDPGTRPWPSPVTTRTVAIPSYIDATGATDVTAALRAFIAGVPDGSIITAAPAAIYKHAGNFMPPSRNNLILDGNGAALRNTATSGGNGGSAIYWSWLDKPFPTHLTFRNWTAQGANPKPGSMSANEFGAFLHAMGGSYLELDNITASGLMGDLATFNENPDHAWVHGCHVIDCGRNVVSIMCGSDILVEDLVVGRAGYCFFDIEPETGSVAGIARVTVRRNRIGTWGNCFVAVDGANAGKPIADIVIDGNTVTGPEVVVNKQVVSWASLLSIVGFSGSGPKARPQRVAFTNNTGPADALKFGHIDGLTVKGNSAAGTFLDCTGVVLA